jgi:Sucrase/ferredoxin-like
MTMTLDTCSPAPALRPAQPLMRCAEAARMRGETPHASAMRERRLLLVEVPGAWGHSALDESFADPGIAQRLGAAAAASDMRVVLIRRPGRHPSAWRDAGHGRPGAGAGPEGAFAWAIADATAGVERVLWGSWRRPADLLDLDLAADLTQVSVRGPQRLALVCTNGKRDRCCAIQGRPVAAAIGAIGGWDTWECSHLGGHRFAATILLLPTGDMFGQLNPESAVTALRQFDAGRFAAPYYRGRCGQPAAVQAALHAAATRLEDFRRDAIQVTAAAALTPASVSAPAPVSAGTAADVWEVEISHRTDGKELARYLVTMSGTRRAPALLSCDAQPKPDICYDTMTFTRIR